jgi:hypothetical protein
MAQVMRVRLVLVLMVLVCTAIPTVAQSGAEGEDPGDPNEIEADYVPGDVTISAGVGLWTDLSFAVSPGFDVMLQQWSLADGMPLTLSAGARGLYNTDLGDSGADRYDTFGLGGFILGHVAILKEDDTAPLLDHFDFYLGIGPSFTYTSYADSDKSSTGGFRPFTGLFGVSYYLSNRLALFAESTYWTRVGGTIGVRVRL